MKSWYDSNRRVDVLPEGELTLNRRPEGTTWVEAIGRFGPKITVGDTKKPKDTSWDSLFNFTIPSILGEPIRGIPEVAPQAEPYNRHKQPEPLEEPKERLTFGKIIKSPYTAAAMMLTATVVSRNQEAIADWLSHVPAQELQVERPWAKKVKEGQQETQKNTQAGWVK